MLNRIRFSALCVAFGIVVFQVFGPGSVAAQNESVVTGTLLGEPIQGITAHEFELFRLGLEDFLEVETPSEGLGPNFNGRSCAECHNVGGIGGAGFMTEVRAGMRREDGSFQDLYEGSVFQLFSIPSHETQVIIPLEANVIARRKSFQLFGAGLIEAVPDEALAALEDPADGDGDGISGVAHRVFDKATQSTRIGRFGWKAQQATLMTFGAEAYRDEMGITNALFPEEVCRSEDCSKILLMDRVRDPEDRRERTTGLRGIDNFENFMKLLGPPPRSAATDDALQGEQLFRTIACSSCHVPSLRTGPSSVKALSFKQFSPFGDFLLHDIGTGDGIVQGQASGEEIRTPPLWGVRQRAPFLHDGRAATLVETIEMHGGEAARARELFRSLNADEKRAVVAFLNSL
jgi:CxxC motif-containing protein (DUF1111 family)